MLNWNTGFSYNNATASIFSLKNSIPEQNVCVLAVWFRPLRNSPVPFWHPGLPDKNSNTACDRHGSKQINWTNRVDVWFYPTKKTCMTRTAKSPEGWMQSWPFFSWKDKLPLRLANLNQFIMTTSRDGHFKTFQHLSTHKYTTLLMPIPHWLHLTQVRALHNWDLHRAVPMKNCRLLLQNRFEIIYTLSVKLSNMLSLSWPGKK